MLQIDSTALRLFESKRQVIRISIVDDSETYRILTEEDIMQGSFGINRTCLTGEATEFGTAIAAELSMTINNSSGKYSNVAFEGALLYVELGVADWDKDEEIHYIPQGWFVVNSREQDRSLIYVSALDLMVRFDKKLSVTGVKFPQTITQLVNLACSSCDIQLATDVSQLPNAAYKVATAPEDVETWRDLLQNCAQLMGVNAVINMDGLLEFKRSEETAIVIRPDDRYYSSFSETDVYISGCKLEYDSKTYLAGTDECALDLSSNPLVRSDFDKVLSALYNAVKDIKYRPCSVSARFMPQIEVMDMIRVMDLDGVTHRAWVTSLSSGINAGLDIVSSGETAESQQHIVSKDKLDSQYILMNKVREMITGLKIGSRNYLETSKALGSGALYNRQDYIAHADAAIVDRSTVG